MQGVSKVRIGQRVIVRLTGFSEQKYGFVEGKVILYLLYPMKKGIM